MIAYIEVIWHCEEGMKSIRAASCPRIDDGRATCAPQSSAPGAESRQNHNPEPTDISSCEKFVSASGVCVQITSRDF